MRAIKVRCIGMLTVGLAIAQDVRPDGLDHVAVASSANEQYVHRKFGEPGGKAKPESYVLAQGRFFGGNLRDATLEHTQFVEIAHVLAPSLAQQSFYPAGDAKGADILIVVHWGITGVEEDASHGQMDMERMNKDASAYNASAAKGGVTDPGAINSDLDFMRAGSAAVSGGPALNARLLGFSEALAQEEYRSVATASGMTEMDYVLRDKIQDERYFVIVMAYDLKALGTAEKGRKLKLLWSTHMSIRALGRNFTTALPEMSGVAARYFGHQLSGLLLNAEKVPEGKVEIGEPRTVEDKK
jgi:hypothetical protein